MLTEAQAQDLLTMVKQLVSMLPIRFPLAGELLQFELRSEDRRNRIGDWHIIVSSWYLLAAVRS